MLIRLHCNRRQFIFRVEATGVLKPAEIIDQAFEVLIDKLRSLQVRRQQVTACDVALTHRLTIRGCTLVGGLEDRESAAPRGS